MTTGASPIKNHSQYPYLARVMMIVSLLGSSLVNSQIPELGGSLTIIYNRNALHPQVKTIYADIINGIRRGYADNGPVLEITDGVPDVVSADAVVVLGNTVVREALAADMDKPMVVGAVSWNVDAVYGVRIIPDPALVFENLRALVPAVNNIYIVVDANSRLLNPDYLVAAAKGYGIKAIIKQASDIKEAASIYAQLAKKMQSQDALWIPPGDRFVNKTLLSTLLIKSWKSYFAVISSNPYHVSKGALFAVSPDYYLMGKRLGELAQQILDNPMLPPSMQPVRDVILNVNQRMANHMGVKIQIDEGPSENKTIQIQVQ